MPFAAIAAILPTVIEALGGVVGSLGVVKEEKLAKITSIASSALGGVTYAIDAFDKIKDRLKEGKITEADFDDLIAEIDANSAKIDELTKPSA